MNPRDRKADGIQGGSGLDRRWVRRSFDRAAASYDRVAVLQRAIGDELLTRLDYIRLAPERVLDLGAGTGRYSAALAKRYRRARILGVDIATAMLRQAERRAPWFRPVHFAAADVTALPVRSQSIDLLFSNLTLQWCSDLNGALREAARVLRPGGLFMFTTFGPDTLRELRQAWEATDGYSHVNAFTDMHDIGDALVAAAMEDPVMDVDWHTLYYPDVHTLMRELKDLGAHNVTLGRNRALTGKGRLRSMAGAYEAVRDDRRGLPASFEVVFGHAWAPRQRQREPGVTTVPVGAIGRHDGA